MVLVFLQHQSQAYIIYIHISYIIYIYIYPIPTIFHYHHGPPLGPHGSRIGAPFASPHHAAAAPSRGCSAPHGGGIGGWQGEHHFPGSSAFFGSLMARFSSETEMISFFWLFFFGGDERQEPFNCEYDCFRLGSTFRFSVRICHWFQL